MKRILALCLVGLFAVSCATAPRRTVDRTQVDAAESQAQKRVDQK